MFGTPYWESMGEYMNSCQRITTDIIEIETKKNNESEIYRGMLFKS